MSIPALLLLCLTIISAPLYIIRFNVFIPTTVLEILLIFTVFINFIDFLKDGLPWKKLRTKFDLIILLFLINALVSTLLSVDKIGGAGILKAYFIEPVLFFYCLVYQIRKYRMRPFIISLILTGVWLSVLGLLQKFTGSFSLAPYEIAQGRISAVYNSANSLALFLGPIVPVVIVYFVKDKRLKIPFFISLVLFTLIIYWTKSRGGLVAEFLSLLAFVFGYFLMKVKRLQKVWFVFPAAVAIIITFFFYQIYLNYTFLPSNGQEDQINKGDTLQIRYFIWAGTINMLKDNPLFGAGLDGFHILYENKYKLPQYPENFQYPHNLLLTFWTETGIAGLSLFLLILVSALSVLIKGLNSSKDYLFGLGLISALTYWIIHGFVDVPYFKNDLSLEFWIILAFIVGWMEKTISNKSTDLRK